MLVVVTTIREEISRKTLWNVERAVNGCQNVFGISISTEHVASQHDDMTSGQFASTDLLEA